jgi:hypothetical protein
LRERVSLRPSDRSRDDPKQQRDRTYAQHGYLLAVAQFLPLNSSLFDDNQWILWTTPFTDAFSISRVLRPRASAKKPAPRQDQ